MYTHKFNNIKCHHGVSSQFCLRPVFVIYHGMNLQTAICMRFAVERLFLYRRPVTMCQLRTSLRVWNYNFVLLTEESFEKGYSVTFHGNLTIFGFIKQGNPHKQPTVLKTFIYITVYN